MTHDVVVPEYRTVGGQWYDEFGRVFLVTDPKLGFVNETRLRPGVEELEGFVGKTGVPSIRLAVPYSLGSSTRTITLGRPVSSASAVTSGTAPRTGPARR